VKSRKRISQPWDPPVPRKGRRGKIAALVMGFGIDDTVLRLEATISIPSERLLLAYRSWNLTGVEAEDEKTAGIVADYCYDMGAQELRFGPERVPMSEASIRHCTDCEALTAFTPWGRHRALREGAH
jgi:hypothetical protein